MNNFIEIKNDNNSSIVINLQQVVTFYPSYEYVNPNKIDGKKNILYYVAFRLNGNEKKMKLKNTVNQI